MRLFKKGDVIKRHKGPDRSDRGMLRGNIYGVLYDQEDIGNVRICVLGTREEVGSSMGWDPDNFILVQETQEIHMETYKIF